MTYKNKAILFVYRSGNDVSMGACDRYFVEIMQTLKIKGE
jgi:hypothetical protein